MEMQSERVLRQVVNLLYAASMPTSPDNANNRPEGSVDDDNRELELDGVGAEDADPDGVTHDDAGSSVDGEDKEGEEEYEESDAAANGDGANGDAAKKETAAEDAVEGDIADDEAIAEEDADFDEEEFTLDQLSEAYAKVLQERESGDGVAGQETELEPAVEREADSGAGSGSGEVPVDEPEPEVDDDAACPISPESILESILFVGAPKDVKLTSRNIAPLMRNVSAKEVTALAKKLNAKYEQEGAAFRVECERGTMKMVLAPELNTVQNFMLGRYRAVRLSQQAIDVLAIIAYNQPITRTQLDSIRTKTSGGIVRQMIRRGLVAVEEGSGRKDVYRTTDRFLDLFGLDSIEDLPQSHDASGMEELAD